MLRPEEDLRPANISKYKKNKYFEEFLPKKRKAYALTLHI